jgi:hypothetical protein
MVIEADSSSLAGFLKNSGSTAPVATSAPAVTPANPLQPINDGVANTTDSLDRFTNLLEAINKLISQPIVKGVMEKGVSRKSGEVEEAPQLQAPPGFNPPNGASNDAGLPPPQQPPQEVKKSNTEQATLFYSALLKSVEELVKQNPKRTIEEIHEELSQESVKEQLIKQIEVIM